MLPSHEEKQKVAECSWAPTGPAEWMPWVLPGLFGGAQSPSVVVLGCPDSSVTFLWPSRESSFRGMGENPQVLPDSALLFCFAPREERIWRKCPSEGRFLAECSGGCQGLMGFAPPQHRALASPSCFSERWEGTLSWSLHSGGLQSHRSSSHCLSLALTPSTMFLGCSF